MTIEDFHRIAVIKTLLDEGIVQILLDARHPEVSVPHRFKERHDLALDLSYSFLGFPMLVNEERGIEALLSFDREPSLVLIPWEAIWAAGRANSPFREIFLASVPPEAWKKESTVSLKALEGMGEVSPPRSGHLKLVN